MTRAAFVARLLEKAGFSQVLAHSWKRDNLTITPTAPYGDLDGEVLCCEYGGEDRTWKGTVEEVLAAIMP